jgi:hypothetical protein
MSISAAMSQVIPESLPFVSALVNTPLTVISAPNRYIRRFTHNYIEAINKS